MSTYYIDAKTGNDSNNGTFENPFKTIKKFSNIAIAGDNCYIREGTYRESFKPQNSGQENSPITYESYQNEKVILSGTKIIEGNWTELNNGIYSIRLNPNEIEDLGIGHNQLFFNNEMMIESRFPKINNAVNLQRKNHLISLRGDFIGEFEDTEKSGIVKTLAYYEASELNDFPEDYFNNSYISFVPGHEWWGNTGKIVKSKPGRIEFEFEFRLYKSKSQEKYGKPSQDDPFYIWGNYNLLNSEKEWFFDNKNHTLYLKPPGDIKNGTIEFKQITTILHLSDCSYLNFKNIEIFSGIIVFNDFSHYNTLDNILSLHGSHNFGIDGWITIPPIYLHGSHNKVINSTIKNSSGPILIHGHDHILENNVIHDISYSSKSLSGIQDGGEAYNVKISHNTIFNCGGIGISCTFKSSEINNNHIWNVARLKTDTSGINAYDAGDLKGTTVSYNLIHDVWGYKDTVQHWGGYGIRLDGGRGAQGNSNCDIHNNIVFNTSSSSIGIWGIPRSGDNYDDSLINVYNNTVDGVVILAEANKSHAGHKIFNNIASELQTVGHSVGTEVKPYIPNKCIIKDNLFAKNIKNNFNLNDTKYSNLEQLPGELFPVNKSIITLPYNSSININNKTIGNENVYAGSFLLQSDLKKLIITEEHNLLKITGHPIGKIFPQFLQIKYNNINETVTPINYIDLEGTVYSTLNLNENINEISFSFNNIDYIKYNIRKNNSVIVEESKKLAK